MKNLKGKTAFITGGASGIGLGIAKACGEEGMNVVIADLRQNAIDEALPLFREKNWPALGVRLDVTDREAYAKAADEAEAAFGNIHILVNNAGIGCGRGPLWEVSYRDTDLAVGINLTAVLNGIQVITPRILKHGESGHIVSTASKAALIPVPRNGLYNLTKQAVVAIMETLACDLKGTNVGASVFCPGPFKSSLGVSSGEVEAELTGIAPPPVDGGAARHTEKWAALERPAEEAGRRVIRGIKRDDLYILTHSEFKNGFSARADAVLRAFPDETPNDEFFDVFGFLTYNDIFDRQSDVPAYNGQVAEK